MFEYDSKDERWLDTYYKKVNPSCSEDMYKHSMSPASDNERIEVYTQLPSQAPSENQTSGTHSRSQILIQADDDTCITYWLSSREIININNGMTINSNPSEIK